MSEFGMSLDVVVVVEMVATDAALGIVFALLLLLLDVVRLLTKKRLTAFWTLESVLDSSTNVLSLMGETLAICHSDVEDGSGVALVVVELVAVVCGSLLHCLFF
jgi:hypothetical protein